MVIEILDTVMGELGLTQHTLAVRTGLSQGTISDYYRRRRPVPAHVAERISWALGGRVSVAELVFPDGLLSGATMTSDQWNRLPPRLEGRNGNA